MCPAEVEIFSKDAVVSSSLREIGRGNGNYKLRSFNPELDIPVHAEKLPDVEIEGISNIQIDLGNGKGEITITSGSHDTTVYVHISPRGALTGIVHPGSYVILGPTRGMREPYPVLIHDKNGNLLVKVTHTDDVIE